MERFELLEHLAHAPRVDAFPTRRGIKHLVPVTTTHSLVLINIAEEQHRTGRVIAERADMAEDGGVKTVAKFREHTLQVASVDAFANGLMGTLQESDHHRASVGHHLGTGGDNWEQSQGAEFVYYGDVTTLVLRPKVRTLLLGVEYEADVADNGVDLALEA